ncbi:MAG: hypothetical protein Fues2KO_52030 [Fuerstiella sp.]
MRYLTTIICLLIAAPAYAQATAVITGPEQANPGDLIILNGDESYADDLAWSLVNSDKAFLPVDSNQKCVFASGIPGTYIFVLAASKASEDVGSTVAVARHSVRIGKPQPEPEPGPGPKPPQPPSPPSPPAPDLTGVAKASFDAVSKINARSDEIAAVSQALKTTAGKAAGLSWSIKQMNEAYASEMRATVFAQQEARDRWTPYAEFYASTMRPTTDVLDAVENFNAMAEGLDAFLSMSAAPSRDLPNEGLKSTIQSLEGTVRGLKDTLDHTKQQIHNIREEIGS